VSCALTPFAPNQDRKEALRAHCYSSRSFI